MIKIKSHRTLFFVLFILLIYGCSSKNTPIAEVFLGKWTIYEKIEDNTKDTSVTGEMNIFFETDEIKFTFTTEEETPVQLSGVVFNQDLFKDSELTEYVGRLELSDDILNISLEDGITYNAR